MFCDFCGFGEVKESVDLIELNKFYAETYREPGTDLHLDFSRKKEPASFDPRSFAQLSLVAIFCAQDLGKKFFGYWSGHW